MTRPTELSTSSDWFIAAIATDGSVGQCLDAVLDDLNAKSLFVTTLRSVIAEKTPGGVDRITDFGLRLRTLENTLRFRLSILSPERKGAWFRPASTAVGPFKETLFSEAVFSAYDETQQTRVIQGFALCWEKRNLVDYPLRATESCLWKILLSLNFELEEVDCFMKGSPRLSELPERLPQELDSRSLRAFLLNVRAEILSHRHRLTQCYMDLLASSERYWRHHATQSAKRSEKVWNTTQSEFQFKARRHSTTTARPRIKTSSDLEALRFMGFSDYPSLDDLKQRYHTLALEMHPDRPTGNEQRFKLLTKSYKHLSKACVGRT